MSAGWDLCEPLSSVSFSLGVSGFEQFQLHFAPVWKVDMSLNQNHRGGFQFKPLHLWLIFAKFWIKTRWNNWLLCGFHLKGSSILHTTWLLLTWDLAQLGWNWTLFWQKVHKSGLNFRFVTKPGEGSHSCGEGVCLLLSKHKLAGRGRIFRSNHEGMVLEGGLPSRMSALSFIPICFSRYSMDCTLADFIVGKLDELIGSAVCLLV